MKKMKSDQNDYYSTMEKLDRLTIRSLKRTHQTHQSICIPQSPKLKSMIEEAKKTQQPGTIIELYFPENDDMIGLAVSFLNHGTYEIPVEGPGFNKKTGLPYYKYSPMMWHIWIHEVAQARYMDVPLLEKWTAERFLEEMEDVPTWNAIAFSICTRMAWEVPDECLVVQDYCVLGAYRHLDELVKSPELQVLMERKWWGEFSFRLLVMIAKGDAEAKEKAKTQSTIPKHWREGLNV